MSNVSIRNGTHRLLESRLRTEVEGRVRFDETARGAYARDASHFRQVPVGVVEPRTVADIEATVAACVDAGAPVLPRGAGTSLAGQCCNTAVVLDCSRHLNVIEELDPEQGRAVVQPGVVLDDLQRRAAPHGLWFGPDPSTHGQCTIGGMIGNNACGVHSVSTGRTVDNVERLEILTTQGERFWVGPGAESGHDAIAGALADLGSQYADEIHARFPSLPRRVSGYNLDELIRPDGPDLARALVGTEGTCAVVLRAEVRLLPRPPARALVILGYDDIVQAGRRVPELLEWEPVGLEGIDAGLTRGLAGAAAELPPAGAHLFVEIPGDSIEAAEERARQMATAVAPSRSEWLVAASPGDVRRLWSIRESGIRASTRVFRGRPVWPGWEDSAVPPDRFGDYLHELRSLMDGHGYQGGMYGHFGDGCLHLRLDFDLASDDGRRRYRRFIEDAADLVVAFGGSLSGEHGDGQARGELLDRMYGDRLVGAFREFRQIWDPTGLLNPGKVVDARPLDADLAADVSHDPDRNRRVFFTYPDNESFDAAAGRCVGVGKCRDTSSGTMCPSFMATGDEIHSTRGRARLLQEMLRGEVVTGGWQSDAVDEALDLCLACKGCLDECPVQVDMATYKAEFLAQRYRRRLRPLRHYILGLSPTWARLASAVSPALANRVGNSRLAAPLKKAVGIDPERPTPTLAAQSLQAWWRRSGVRAPDAPDVVLFPDTFTNRFEPEVGQAAVRVLEAAGLSVHIPTTRLCCGLPQVTMGMLRGARRQMERTINVLDATGDAPIVGLEPSCTAVFRHELPALLPGDERAARVGDRIRTLSEVFRDVPGWRPPDGDGRLAQVQFHCHHRAVLGIDADRDLLARTGLTVDVLDAGCCGLAGSFGFESGHAEVARAVGDRVLFPALRDADPDGVVLADGFSCRRQIEYGTGRTARHLAQVLDPGRTDEEEHPSLGR